MAEIELVFTSCRDALRHLGDMSMLEDEMSTLPSHSLKPNAQSNGR